MSKKTRVSITEEDYGIFSDRNLVQYLVQYLPIISVMSLKRAFPNLALKKDIVEITWNRLVERCPVAELALKHRDFIVGSSLLQVLLGTDWVPNDIDIVRESLVPYSELDGLEKRFTDYGYGGTESEFISGVTTFLLPTQKIRTAQLICLFTKNMINAYVDSFDFSFLKAYLTPDRLLVKFPHRILHNNLEQVVYLTMRVGKYQERGFRFNVIDKVK